MYNIGSLKLGDTFFTTNIDVSVDNLATMPAMVDSFSSHHKIYPDKLYSYNNRLHLLQIKKNLFKGYKIVEGAENYNFKIYTYIHASDGDKVVVTNEKGTYIPSFIIYPDSRAYKMVINCDNPQKGFSVYLKSSDFLIFHIIVKNLNLQIFLDQTLKQDFLTILILKILKMYNILQGRLILLTIQSQMSCMYQT